jgi:hypothetical protein
VSCFGFRLWIRRFSASQRGLDFVRSGGRIDGGLDGGVPSADGLASGFCSCGVSTGDLLGNHFVVWSELFGSRRSAHGVADLFAQA